MGSRLLAPVFFGLVLFAGVLLMAHTITNGGTGQGSAESFRYPQVILSLWIAFSALSVAQSLRRRETINRGNTRTLLLAVAAMAFLCFALAPLGFLPTAFLFFLGYGLALGYRKIPVLAGAAAAATALFWFMFEKFLEIPLPAGEWLG